MRSLLLKTIFFYFFYIGQYLFVQSQDQYRYSTGYIWFQCRSVNAHRVFRFYNSSVEIIFLALQGDDFLKTFLENILVMIIPEPQIKSRFNYCRIMYNDISLNNIIHLDNKYH